jgi:hypothetical protein
MGRPGKVLSLVTPDKVPRFMGRMKKVAGGVQVGVWGGEAGFMNLTIH